VLLCGVLCSYARAADLFVTALRVAGNSAVTARSGSAPRVLALVEVDGADSEYWEATLFNLGHAFRKLKYAVHASVVLCCLLGAR
jgi:hypothetical protein